MLVKENHLNLNKKTNNLEKELQNYFAKDYYDARNKFRTISKQKKLKVTSKKIINDLTCDIAIYEKKTKSKMIIFVSGVHGVEGYVGSAFQIMFIDRYLDIIKNKTSVCFIHALNPHGFKNNRRVNENNVDINRNFADFQNIEINPKIKKIIEEYNYLFYPKNFKKKDLYNSFMKSIIQYGKKETIGTMIIGQNIYPKGLNYTGNKLEKSSKIFIDFIKKITKNYKEVILIDLHTGTGKKYKIHGETHHPIKSKEYNYCKKIVPKLNSYSKQKIYNNYSLGLYFLKTSKAKQNYELVIEFGTVSNFSKIQSAKKLTELLLKENICTNKKVPFKEKNKIRTKLKNAYFPQDKKYKVFVSKQVDKIGKKLLKINN